MITLPRDGVVFGRPLGEWLFLGALALIGGSQLQSAATGGALDLWQWSVLAANAVIGLAALGVVVATLAGRAFGIPLLWTFAAAACYAAAMATWAYGGAPAADVVVALAGAAVVAGAIVWYGTRRLHAAVTRQRWPALLAEHAAAADEFVAAIAGLSPAEWTARPSPESWSPAEITEHLARTYSQYAGESRGKNSLRIRLGFFSRTLARLFIKPRLLAGRPFPKARAPSSLRPAGGPPTPADGVALFRATGDACLRDLAILVQRRPHRRLVHPYLGGLPLFEVVRFASQHIHHHRRQLIAAAHAAREPRS